MGTMVETQPTQAQSNNGLDDVRFTTENFLHHQTGESIEKHYDIGEMLGEGGFGVVYRGKHTKTGAERAIKKMEKDPRDKLLNDEIIQEFNFLKELDHPNLLKAYDMFETEPDFYIVSDLYGGGDVLDYLDEAGYLPEDMVKVFMNKLLSCIDYLHTNKRMVHRDLKLENVLLDEGRDFNDMKLIDFGLALHFDNPDSKFSDLVGSTSYVAPQVIEGSYTCKCDIWSCGVIAFGLLAGYTPFDMGDDGATLQEILVGEVVFDDEVWDSISDEAKDFICNLLAYEEDERPSARQALTHPWLQDYRQNAMDASLKEINDSVRESILGLQNFRSKGCKLKQATCAILASQLLSKEERETINDDFRFLNRSMGGSITKEDLRHACGDVGLEFQDIAVDSVFEEVNYSGTGAISYSEFAIAMMFEKGMVEDKLSMVFEMLDKDNNSKISNSDLQATLALGEESCDKMLQPLRLDDDGMLTFDMFKEAILSNESMDVSDSDVSAAPEEEEEPEPVVEEEEEEEAPEPEEIKLVEEEVPKEEPNSDELTLQEKIMCITWYNRFGRPDQQKMIRLAKKMGDECPITEEMVNKMPWVCGGMMIHTRDINAIMAAEALPSGDITDEAKFRRRSSVRQIEIDELAKLSAGMDDSLANQPIEEEDVSDKSSNQEDNKPEEKLEAVQEEEKAVEPAAEPKEEKAADKPATKPKEAKKPPLEKKAANKPLPGNPNRKTNKMNPKPPKVASPEKKPVPEKKPAPEKKPEIAPYNPNLNRKTSRAPVGVSSVLAGSSTHSIRTETRLDTLDASGKQETILQSRSVHARKERNIFASAKKAPEVDWEAVASVPLKIASPEERKKNKPNFDFVSLVKADEVSKSTTEQFSASSGKKEEAPPMEDDSGRIPAVMEESKASEPVMDHPQMDHSQMDHSQMDNSQMDNSQMDDSQMDDSQMDDSRMSQDLSDTVHAGSSKKMSSSSRSASSPRRGTNVYKPSSRKPGSKSKFPKNSRRTSTAVQSTK